MEVFGVDQRFALPGLVFVLPDESDAMDLAITVGFSFEQGEFVVGKIFGQKGEEIHVDAVFGLFVVDEIFGNVFDEVAVEVEILLTEARVCVDVELVCLFVLALEMDELFFGGSAGGGDGVFAAFFAGEFGVGTEKAGVNFLSVDVAPAEFAALFEVGGDFGHDVVGRRLSVTA